MFASMARRLSGGAAGLPTERSKRSIRSEKSATGLVRMLPGQLFKAKPTTGEAGNNTLDRTLYSMPMPENVDAMTDLLKLHKDGDKFPYVALLERKVKIRMLEGLDC